MLCTGVAVGVGLFFFWLIGDIFLKGAPGITWEFLWDEPENAGRKGGIAPVLVSTAAILLVTLGTAVPIGFGTAVFLAEFSQGKTTLGRMVRRALDVLASVPSIIFGLFGNAVFSHWMGLGFSILSGGLTLACMVLPILIRTIEAGLRAVPLSTRLSAAALGLSRVAVLRDLIFPAAVPSLAAGLLLGLGRALSETAALIFTSGYVSRMPESLLDSGRSLSVHIYDLAMNVPGGDTHAYASAWVLIVLLFSINGLTALCLDHWGKTRMRGL